MGIGAIGSHGLIGNGPTSKMIGFGVDQIVNAQIVLANGELVNTKDVEYSQLLFGIRGAAPNFGIVV